MTTISTAPYALTTTTPRFCGGATPNPKTAVYNPDRSQVVPELVDIRAALTEGKFDVCEDATIRYWHTSVAVDHAQHRFDEVTAVLCLLKVVVDYRNDELFGFDFERRLVAINPLRMSFDFTHAWSENMDLVPCELNAKDFSGTLSEWPAFIAPVRELVTQELDQIKTMGTWARDIEMVMAIATGDELNMDLVYQYMVDQSVAPADYRDCLSSVDMAVTLLVEAVSGQDRDPVLRRFNSIIKLCPVAMPVSMLLFSQMLSDRFEYLRAGYICDPKMSILYQLETQRMFAIRLYKTGAGLPMR